jgi:hypothetical protein
MRAILAAMLLLGCTVLAHGQANPAARPARDVTALAGSWNGSHLEQRQSCRASQNNGFHGTYSEYGIFVDTVGHAIVVNEAGITGLTCTWTGQYRDDNGQTSISGTLSCSDGRMGTFETRGFFVLATMMSVRLNAQLSGSESCSIDVILSGARF